MDWHLVATLTVGGIAALVLASFVAGVWRALRWLWNRTPDALQLVLVLVAATSILIMAAGLLWFLTRPPDYYGLYPGFPGRPLDE